MTLCGMQECGLMIAECSVDGDSDCGLHWSAVPLCRGRLWLPCVRAVLLRYLDDRDAVYSLPAASWSPAPSHYHIESPSALLGLLLSALEISTTSHCLTSHHVTSLHAPHNSRTLLTSLASYHFTKTLCTWYLTFAMQNSDYHSTQR